MNENFAKLIAIGIVGGVAKALFAPPRPIAQPQQGTTADLHLINQENN